MTQPSLEFYAVAAQVIPLLFLALAIEFRYFGRSRETITILSELSIVAFLVIGEYLALRVLATGEPTRAARSLVVVALGVGGLGAVIAVVRPSLAHLRDQLTAVIARRRAGRQPPDGHSNDSS